MTERENDPAESDIAVVEGLISSIHLPADSEQRLRVASQAAYAIDKMRREYAVQSLSPVSIGRMLRALAALAGVSLQPVLESFGLQSLQPARTTAPALARLLTLLDMTFERIREPLRIAFADQVDPERAGMLMAAHRGGRPGRSMAEDLSDMENGYSGDQREELHTILEIVEKECKTVGQGV